MKRSRLESPGWGKFAFSHPDFFLKENLVQKNTTTWQKLPGFGRSPGKWVFSLEVTPRVNYIQILKMMSPQNSKSFKMMMNVGIHGEF